MDSVTVQSLIPKDAKVITLSESQNLATACRTFSQHRFQSFPVINESGSLTGVLGLTDIAFVLLEKSRGQFDNTLVKDAVNISGENVLATISPSASLKELLDKLLSNDRVVVVNEAGAPIFVLSKMSVVTYVSKNLDLIKDIADVKLGDLNIDTKLVKGMKGSSTVRQTIQFLLDHRIGGVAYYDNTGHVCGNFSIKDVTGVLQHTGLDGLELPTDHFIKARRAENLRAVHPTIHVTYSDPFSLICEKFAAVKVHRMFTKKAGEERTCGVLSLGDLLKAIKKCA